MSAFGRAAAQITCVCCKNFGELPHLPGLPQAVVPGTVEQMCDECIDAAFLSGGTRPHPHPFIHAAPASPVHACPVNGSGVTGCCGRTLYELPVTDRVTQNRHQVTCTDRENGNDHG